MSLKTDYLSRLIGNLWQPKLNVIQQLRETYSLPKSPIAQPRSLVLASYSSERDLVANKANTKVFPIADAHELSHKSELAAAVQAQAPQLESTSNQQREKSPLFVEWDLLCDTINQCKDCKLVEKRQHTVIERGKRNASWMFIGEGPGEEEDKQGRPFVGASGQLLDKMITAMNLDPLQDVYITNVVKCRPPNNRNPEIEEIAACNNYLQSQIQLVNPQIIITLGRYAAQSLLNSQLAVGKLRGKIHHYQNIPLIVTYHPAYLLRTPTAKKDAWIDLQLAMRHSQKP